MELSVLVPLLSCITVVLLVLGLFSPRKGTLQQRLQPYGHSLPRTAGDALSTPFTARVVSPILHKLSGLIAGLAPAHMQQAAREQLEAAGSTMSPNAFLTLRLGGVTLLPLFYAALQILNGGPWLTLNVFLLGIFFFVGWFGPKGWLDSQGGARRTKIEHALPDALDLIVVSMEAGLSFDAGLAKVVEKTSGPLRDEFQRMLQEISLGKLRREALRDLGRRCHVPDLTSFVNAMVQADQMGISIGQVLRAQSDEARLKRRQRAEEQGMKAPVKILFPLLLCIFPAMMIPLMGPAVLSIYRNLLPALSR